VLKSKRLFLISIFTILISMAMLISATFAWFTSTVSTNANAVKSATYNITATITKEDSTSINPTIENNVTSITFPSTGTYNVTVTPNGNANNGYCIVNFKNTDYYTENLTSGSFTFTVNATENEVLTITPSWGTYSSNITSILNDENKTIGTASSFGGGQTQNTANLLSGNNFNEKLIQNIGSATSLVFTDTNAPENATTADYSINQNGSVLGWLDGNTYYISSLESGKKVIGDSDCENLFKSTSFASINLTNFDTSNVTIMGEMFYGCSSLTTITFWENFNTSKVEVMKHMFSGCSSLTSLDLSNFDISSVTDMSYMFSGDSGLVSLDISSFNFSNATMSGMFSDCTYLTEVLVKDEATQTKLINGDTGISNTSYIKVKTVVENPALMTNNSETTNATENPNSQENLDGSTTEEDNLTQNS
jgi:predicted ribosomally synthesized peptide with SipW-like signal peptide